jgi:hypothetical protein
MSVAFSRLFWWEKVAEGRMRGNTLRLISL